MPQTRERACEGKRRYLSRKDAAKAARGIRRTGRTQGNPSVELGATGRDLHMRPYDCPYCAFWHIGHPIWSDDRQSHLLDVPFWQQSGCPDCAGRRFTRTDELVICDGCGLAVDEA